MSTILKALRRLEEEKARGVTSRPLREDVASGPREAPRRRRLPWLPVTALLIGAGLGASAWWVWPYERGGEPVREAAGEGATASAPVVAGTPAEGRVAGPAPVSPPDFHASAAEIESQLHGLAEVDPITGEGPHEDAFASGVEVVERPKPTPRIEPPPEGARQERVIADPPRVAAESPALAAKRSRRTSALTRAAAAPTASPAPRVASAPAPAPTSAPAPAPDAAAAPGAKPAPTAAPVKAAAAAAPAKTPLAVPARTRPSEPAPAAAASSSAGVAVRVKRTQWHPEPGRRSAEVDLAGRSQSVHEGDVVGEYVVTEIRPSGVVLTRDGVRVERGIGQAP